MNYKMLVLDLDGTLLNDEKQISEKNIHILNELHKIGIIIVIATGRNYFMAKELTEKIRTIEPVIMANNGAIIRHSENDELLECNYLDFLVFKNIYKQGLKHNLDPIIHVDEYANGYDLIYERENYEEVYKGYIRKDYHRAKYREFEITEIKNILSVCYLGDYNQLCEFSRHMKPQSKGRFNIICNRNVSNRALLEFLHIDGCKWTAIRKYAVANGINTDEIIAIGDDSNDIELLMNSGLGIAMKNGTDECIKAAKYITEYDNNNSGVYYALSEVFKIK
ncbi:MAG: HAD family hydrolase [Sedimentibacter sp.]|uniref:HAD family hydrolase n=1 Tax=Sedimentibacter sp. TaxID=1960295 RepID=UPI002980A272|nr:HAD family hydrolase [Sedimentibacter sp.]MDW5299369.1 HAD family hydrolase [Sedimentibacter sp.]